jgi:hypothetical protein
MMTLAHIHTGAAGTNGGVLIDFSSQVPAAGGIILDDNDRRLGRQ